MIDPAATLALIVDLYMQLRAKTADAELFEEALKKVQPKDDVTEGSLGDHH